MDNSAVEKHTEQLLLAIEACIAGKFTLPGLILMYSAIDIMAWLGRDETHEDVLRSDFISWVDTFFLPDSGLSCTAIDLCSARCSLVHSYSAESRLSREGEARVIYYAWGNAQEKDLQELIEWVNTRDAKAVHVEKLFAALKVGVSRFIGNSAKLTLAPPSRTRLSSGG